MMKAFHSYLLFLGIFLLGSQSFFGAPVNQDVVHASSENIKSSSLHKPCDMQNSQNQSVRSFSSGKKINISHPTDFVLYDEDEDEDGNDKLVSIKKQSEKDYNVPSALFTKTSGSFSFSLQKTVSFHSHVSYTLSNRYLVFRVFRI